MSTVEQRLQTHRNDSLTTKVASLTDQMSPGENHELSLRSAAVSKASIREFEGVFNQPLDLNTGVNLTLSFDPDSAKMRLDRASFALSGTPIVGTLERTEGIGYMRSFMKSNGDPIASYMPDIGYTSDELLGALAIEQPDVTDAEAYRLWRANLLSLANGWRIDEYTDFIDDIDPTFTVDTENSIRQRMLPGIIKYFRILNSEIYGKRKQDPDPSHISVQSVAQVIEANLPSENENDRDTLHFFTLAELRSNDYDRQVVELSRKVLKTNNSISNIVSLTPAEVIADERDELDFRTYNQYLHIMDLADEAVKRAKASKPTRP